MALKFTETQKRVAQALLSSPLTKDQLREKTALSSAQVEEELKFLQQLKLISLSSESPPNYALLPLIAEELKRRKSLEAEDDNRFRVRVLIEVQAVEETMLQKQVERVVENMEKEPFFRIYSKTIEPPVKVEERYSTFLDVNLSVRDFRGVIRLMFFYGPSTIEVIKPSKFEFTPQDFQDGLVDMGEMIHAYAEYIMGMMNRKQVEEFNATLFKNAAKRASSVAAASNPSKPLEPPLPPTLETNKP